MIPAVSPSSDSREACRPGTPLESFAAAWLGEPRPDRIEGVAEALETIDAALRADWPRGAPYLDEFWAELSRCLPEALAPGELLVALERLHARELHLAFACRRGHAEALARFDRDHIAGIQVAVGRVDSSPAFTDEIKQRVRAKLLVSDGHSPPKIAHYTGQGDLSTWVRVVAVREALSSVRSDRRKALTSDEALLAIEASATGPELGALKQQYRERFSAAFEAALGELQPAQRNLLRLHYLHGLSIDELGRLLGVHRSSAARRIAKTRQDLLSLTRRRLQAELAMGRQDFEQLMGLIASRLDLSIERFLGERDGSAVATASRPEPGQPHSPGTQ